MKIIEAFRQSPKRCMKHSSYFAVYDDLFRKYKGKEIVFVEVGVLNGGSLFMWRNYFGEAARIIGIDLNPEARKWEDFGFEIYIGSQSDVDFWNDTLKTIGKIDILLDDGGHTYKQQIITVESALPNIKEDGIIVVEDTHTSYMLGFGNRRRSFIRYVHNVTDEINSRSYFLHRRSRQRPVYSIGIYESIVVFRINTELSESEVTLIENGGEDSSASDFRYNDKGRDLISMRSIIHKYIKSKILRRGMKYLAHVFLQTTPSMRGLKKYFT